MSSNITYSRRCQDEAPCFIQTLLTKEIPKSNSRLRLPVLDTEEKIIEQNKNIDALTEFIKDCVYEVPGEKILLRDVYEKFINWLDPIERGNWSLRLMAKRIPFLRGKYGQNNDTYIGNIGWEKKEAGKALGLHNGRLR